MNAMEYEDSMGGLMPQILALTAPPGTRDNSRPFQQQQNNNTLIGQPSTNGNVQSKSGEAGLAAHPYFRRPGRGHNHDCCDACSEGGDLICCDLCPASFHLTCHDPPLEEEEIPTGEWACHQCRMGGNEDEKTSNSSNKSNKSLKVCKKKEDVKIKEENDHKVFAGGREIEISDTPLYTLIKAAAVINPTQFTLPYELTLPANFPGEPKETFIKKNGSRRGLPKKKPYELDNGIVPLPAKLCFQCNKSCRVGPLIPCDFCPLFYHLDCLDPPLTTPPMGRWMCPNHPEHHLDTSLLTSHSLTERVKLWDKFSVPLDQDSVKLNFFQRCHRMNPPFRFKVKKALRSRLRVPGAIKAHYQDPPDLLPHLSPSQYLPFPPPVDDFATTSPTSKSQSTSMMNFATQNISHSCSSSPMSIEMQEENILNVKRENMETDASQPEQRREDETTNDCFGTSIVKPTKEEKYQWLSSLMFLQSSISRHLATNYSVPLRRNRDTKKEGCNEPCNGLDESNGLPSPTKPNFLNGDLVSLESKSQKLCSDRLSNHINHSNTLPSSQSSLSSSSKRNSHKSQKNKYKSLKQKKSSVPSEIVSDALNSLEVSLKERIEEEQDVSLSSLEQSLVDVLAYERLKEILEPQEQNIVFSTPPLSARALLCPLVPDIKLKNVIPKCKNYSTDPVPMTYRILNIGKGSHNHVNLELYGHCNYISHHHASVIFDETTGHYELINYSEYETKVDGVTYHCDYTDKTVCQAMPPPFLQQVKAIIAMRRGVQSVRVTSPPPAMSNRPGENFKRCECRRVEENSRPTTEGFRESGWEGTAVLHHGSYIRLGCLKFVFSVVEEASKGDWSKDTATTYERFLKEAENERESEEKNKEEKSNVKS